jgi:hypothetical protein
VANVLHVAHFVDASCAGATTQDFTAAQDTALGDNAPQFDRLTKQTDLVTIGIGGNDTGLVPLAESCILDSLENASCQQATRSRARTRSQRAIRRIDRGSFAQPRRQHRRAVAPQPGRRKRPIGNRLRAARQALTRRDRVKSRQAPGRADTSARITQRHLAILRSRTKPNCSYSASGPVCR